MPGSAPGAVPVVIFLVVADLPHCAALHPLRQIHPCHHARQAARRSGINVGRHLITVHHSRSVPVSPVMSSPRRAIGRGGMGMGYERSPVRSSAVLLNGGAGRSRVRHRRVIIPRRDDSLHLPRIDAYYQEIVKGVIIVAAVVADQYRQRNRRSASKQALYQQEGLATERLPALIFDE